MPKRIATRGISAELPNKRGDVNPESGLIFWARQKQYSYWVTKDEFDRRKANALNSNRRRDASKLRDWRLAKTYGMKPGQYAQMFSKQNGMCAICGTTVSMVGRGGKKYSLYVDHCHSTGRVRGLLCHSCNSAIGHLRESVELLESAKQYIIKHKYND